MSSYLFMSYGVCICTERKLRILYEMKLPRIAHAHDQASRDQVSKNYSDTHDKSFSFLFTQNYIKMKILTEWDRSPIKRSTSSLKTWFKKN